MTDLVPVTFSVFGSLRVKPMPWNSGPLEFEADEVTAERCAALQEFYAETHGGINVTATPTDVKGEFRVSGLFPKSFAEARGY